MVPGRIVTHGAYIYIYIHIYVYIYIAPINGLKYIGNWGEMTLNNFGHGYIGGYSVKLATRPHEFELCRIHGGIGNPSYYICFCLGGCVENAFTYMYIYIYTGYMDV